MNTNKMQIEIWSDIICPSCYIAKRKFDAALDQFPYKSDVEIIWRSFQLAPDHVTDSTKKLPDFLAQQHGVSISAAVDMCRQVENQAAQNGLDYQLESAIPANTFNANRLSHLARHYNLQQQAEENLFASYFNMGKNIDDPETLIQLGTEIGLNALDIKAMLESDQYSHEVKQDIAEARQMGITSIPFFVFNKKVKFSGAESSAYLLNVLQSSHMEWQSEKGTTPCTIDGNCA